MSSIAKRSPSRKRRIDIEIRRRTFQASVNLLIKTIVLIVFQSKMLQLTLYISGLASTCVWARARFCREVTPQCVVSFSRREYYSREFKCYLLKIVILCWKNISRLPYWIETRTADDQRSTGSRCCLRTRYQSWRFATRFVNRIVIRLFYVGYRKNLYTSKTGHQRIKS